MRLPPLATAFVAWPLMASAAGLGQADEEWLDEVHPIMLAEEEKTFRELQIDEDREEFRRIFWARRDPDPATPENEFKDAYAWARVKADERFRVSGRPGTSTDCGRVFLLLGEPDRVRQQTEDIAPDPALPHGERLSRVTEAWVFRGEQFEGGQAVIPFDHECGAPAAVEPFLQRIARSKVIRPALDYRTDENGRLLRLEDQLGSTHSPARVLLDSPRQDFPMDFDTSYLRTDEGLTGLVGLVRGKATDLPTGSRDGRTFSSISVCTRVTGPDGKEVSWSERPVRADVQPDRSFLASYSTSLLPGRYTLSVGVVVGRDATRGSLVSREIEVPDLARGEETAEGGPRPGPTVGSILFVREIEELAPDASPDPEHPYAAFRLGASRFVPFFGRQRSPDDSVIFFYVAYDLSVHPETGQADAVAAFGILRGGSLVARTPENPLTTRIAASSIGPVSLSDYPPGRYVAQLKVTDRLSGQTAIRNERFEIVAAETKTP